MEESIQKQTNRTREIKGLICLAVAVFLLPCLFSYSPHDPSFTRYAPEEMTTHNFTGKFGSYLADSLIRLLGVPAFFLPLALLVCAYQYFRNHDFELRIQKVLGFSLFLMVCAGFLGALFKGGITFSNKHLEAGGLLGLGISRTMLDVFSAAGTYIILFFMLIVSLFFIMDFSLASVTETSSGFAGRMWQKARSAISAFLAQAYTRPTADKNLPPVAEELADHKKKSKSAKVEQLHFNFPQLNSGGKYMLPPFSLLADPPLKDGRAKRDQLITNSRILEKKLADFGVEARVADVLPGPVITMYELEPASGVKINRITTLADDLALALMAPSIRILAPIPGKSVIGIEIPNVKRDSVFLKDVLNNEAFTRSSLRLPIALGVDFIGSPVIADLAKMPHLLIAGTTGSGKSVALNAMICSILFKAQPEDIKFLMVDPKRLELSSYEGIPHLLHPVVVDPKKASQVLRWTVEEMERRYKVISALGVKSIESYNEMLTAGIREKKARAPKEKEAENMANQNESPSALQMASSIEHVHLPYIIVAIDELADLMMAAPRDVEESVTRLAQMARAAGIHLIIATQRPSVDVITGLIKANFPTRISFKVSSKIDSRTIIDQQGAEQLLGAGDMLFIPPGTSKLTRIHGAYLSEEEISGIVDFIKFQAQPKYDTSIEQYACESSQAQHENEGYDEKYDEAVALVGELGQASISLVQRYLKIGYNRAARMIEQMEREGIVGPSDGAKPRKVLIRKLPGGK